MRLSRKQSIKLSVPPNGLNNVFSVSQRSCHVREIFCLYKASSQEAYILPKRGKSNRVNAEQTLIYERHGASLGPIFSINDDEHLTR